MNSLRWKRAVYTPDIRASAAAPKPFWATIAGIRSTN